MGSLERETQGHAESGRPRKKSDPRARARHEKMLEKVYGRDCAVVYGRCVAVKPQQGIRKKTERIFGGKSETGCGNTLERKSAAEPESKHNHKRVGGLIML